LNSNPRHFGSFTFISVFLQNHICLSQSVQVAGAAWWAAMRIMAGVGDLVQRISAGRTGRVLDGWTIERSGDVVCGLYRAHEDENREFLGLASKPRSTVCEWFNLKTTWTVLSGLASKPVAPVFSGLASKLVATVSPGLASKSMA
jgi:hypothetical protein